MLNNVKWRIDYIVRLVVFKTYFVNYVYVIVSERYLKLSTSTSMTIRKPLYCYCESVE